MLISGIPLFVYGVDSAAIAVLLWCVFLFSLFILYIVAGHALIYGPHLFIAGFLDLASIPFGRRNEYDAPVDEDNDIDIHRN